MNTLRLNGFSQMRGKRQSGLTMVELLVALVISMLISLAAISALIVTRQGFTAVDASSQLRDNGRFATDLIQRVVVQSGFKDFFWAAKPPDVYKRQIIACSPCITCATSYRISSFFRFT